MVLTVVTTTGTSIITNFTSEISTCNKLINSFKSKPLADYWDKYKDDIDEVREEILGWACRSRNINNICAEIKSVNMIKEKYVEKEKSFEGIIVRLLSTDTIEGRLATEIVCKLMRDNGINCEFEPEKDIIRGLQVDDAEMFQNEGLYNLAKRLEEFQNSRYNLSCVYNFSGGYKSTIPYITIMAQMFNAPMYYVFEESKQLIEIGRLPIVFDYAAFAENQAVFQKLYDGVDEDTWESIKKENNIDIGSFRACYYDYDGIVQLNALGKIMYDRAMNGYEVLYHVDSPFIKDIRERKAAVEAALSELVRKLDTITEPFETLNDTKIKHDVIKDCYVYKGEEKDNSQVRILYKPKFLGTNYYEIKVFDYDFKRGRYEQDYRSRFERRLELSEDTESKFIRVFYFKKLIY